MARHRSHRCAPLRLCPRGAAVVLARHAKIDDLFDEAELMKRFGHQLELLDGEQARAEINSKKFISAMWTRTGSALVHPGKLADGLRAAATRAGVRIHEHSPVRELRGRVALDLLGLGFDS